MGRGNIAEEVYRVSIIPRMTVLARALRLGLTPIAGRAFQDGDDRPGYRISR